MNEIWGCIPPETNIGNYWLRFCSFVFERSWQLAFSLMQSVGEISYCSQVPPLKNIFDDDKVFVILPV